MHDAVRRNSLVVLFGRPLNCCLIEQNMYLQRKNKQTNPVLSFLSTMYGVGGYVDFYLYFAGVGDFFGKYIFSTVVTPKNRTWQNPLFVPKLLSIPVL